MSYPQPRTEFGTGAGGSSLDQLKLLMASSMYINHNLPRFHALPNNRSSRHGRYCDLSQSQFSPGNPGQSDDTLRSLHQRSLTELGRDVKVLEVNASDQFSAFIERRKSLLRGEEAKLPKSMLRTAEWKQEMLGLELFSSRLSSSRGFSYFEFAPSGKESKLWEEAGELPVLDREQELSSETDSDYCN